MPGILHRSTRKNIGSLVVLLIPGLIVLIPQSEIDRQSRGHLEVVLNVAGDAPLTIAHTTIRRCELVVRDTVENEIRRAITRPITRIRIARENAVVGKLSEKSDVPCIEVVLLVTRRLHTNIQ